MGLISRLFFGKKGKQKHVQREGDEEDIPQEEEFIMDQPKGRMGRENPMNDPSLNLTASNTPQKPETETRKKAKKKLSSKYFGKQILDDVSVGHPTADSNDEIIPPSSSSQQPLHLTKQDSKARSAPSPMTITMTSPPPNPPLQQEFQNQENETPISQSRKPFRPDSQVPMAIPDSVSQARGNLRKVPKRASALAIPTTTSPPSPISQQAHIQASPQVQMKKTTRSPSPQHQPPQQPYNPEPPLRKVALRSAAAATATPPPQPQPMWGRNILRQTSQADRLFGASPLPQRSSPTLSHESLDEEIAQREQMREATRALRQQNTAPTSSPLTLGTLLEQPTNNDEDDISISTFGSGKGRNIPRTRTHSGDGVSVVSSISGDSALRPQPQRKGCTAPDQNRKTSSQLKLPITINRAMTSSTPRPRADSNGAEERKVATLTPREETPRAVARKQMSEVRAPVENKAEEVRREPVRDSSPEVRGQPRKVSRQDTSKTQQTADSRARSEHERVRREKERKMKEREEQERMLQEQREEKEKEEKYQQFLAEEHRRWRIKEKDESGDEFGDEEKKKGTQKKQRSRTVLERLFLTVGEKSEFEEKEQEEAFDAEKFKMIQGSLAAELLELIEKTRSNPRPSPVSSLGPAPAAEGATGVKEESKGKGDEDERSEGSFDEDEYFREIAALSLAEEGGEEEEKESITGKGILSQIQRLPNSMKNLKLSQDAAKTIAKAKRIEEKKKAAVAEANNVLQPPEQPSVVMTSLLSTMVPLRIGRDEEWRQHEAAIQTTRRASASREQHSAAAIEKMKELILEEETEAIHPHTPARLQPHSSSNAHATQTAARPRSKSCGRPLSSNRDCSSTDTPHRGKKLKEMTYGERLWSRAAGSLGGVSSSSSDPVMKELKASAELLGDSLMEKQFGAYRYIDEWEGIEIFNKRSKKHLRQQQVPATPTSAPQHIPFSSPPTSRGRLTSTRRASDEGSRLSLL